MPAPFRRAARQTGLAARHYWRAEWVEVGTFIAFINVTYSSVFSYLMPASIK
jgi:hypothetical protein